MHSIKSFIEKAYNEKGFAAIITVDISGAFDNAWWPKILLTLRNKKCPQNLYNLVKSYFINRKAKLWYQNKEVVRALNVGCPQGSASGPFYWNIQYNDLLEEILENGVEIEGFADDTIVKIRSNTIEDLELKANNAVKILSDWAKRSKLSFNASKTKCVLFTNKLKYNLP
ncbi:MAG TPA: reverse transcriptase domain-containing protein [Ignavibacteriaceae bacterium]